jgi:hypothetical protein
MPSRLLKLAVAGIVASVICFSQLDTASIIGTVLDQSGAVIPNAALVVENQNTGASRNAKANEEGNFVVPVLPVGQYRVTASAAGFKSRTI